MKKLLHWFEPIDGKRIFSKMLYLPQKIIVTFLLFFLFQSASLPLSAQNIIDDGDPHNVTYTGSYQDFVIPNNPQLIKITFSLFGGDGGKATVRIGQYIPVPFSDDIFVEAYSCSSGGGSGAQTFVSFNVGTGAGKIPHGSTIRFIVGQKGQSGTNDVNVIPNGGTGFDYGGGGGGTAVLYSTTPATGPWTLLGVAGGGGGAFQAVLAGVCIGLGSDGGAGRSGESGGDGGGIGYGSGGSLGSGGGSDDAFLGAGGGGAYSRGEGVPCINVTSEGDIILDIGEGGKGTGLLNDEAGGYGGSNEGCLSLALDWRNGGYGYGGGGGGVGVGGGGGGYSGGGAGGVISGGGGGGSFMNNIRESGFISSGGATSNPDNGLAQYQVTLNRPPVASCKETFSVNLDENGNATITGDDLDDGSSDPENQELTFSLNKSTFTCTDVGENEVTFTVTDAYGATSTCVTTVTVVDNTAPAIESVTPSISSLWPNNHRMQEVTVTVNSNDNCPGNCEIISVVSNEPENGPGDGDTDPDYEITGDNTVNLRAERSGTGTGRIYTITVRCTDGSGNSSTASTTVVVSHNITSPNSGSAFKVGSVINFTGSFWDVAGNKHTATWLIDGKTTVKGSVTEPSGTKNGVVTGSYKFTAPGVYKIQMNITDQKGNSTYVNTNGHLDAIVVVYDPNGGYTYGGGYFSSPAGALTGNPSLKGNVSYGFQNNYYKNSTYPKGETQFNFALGSFEFNALNFDYLVISNSMAQFKGTGKIIGGQSGIGFTMTVVDGQLDGTSIDKIRMKIYNKNTNEIYYDNQPGASDAALPTHEVGVNSVIVISGTNAGLTSANTNLRVEAETKPEVILSNLDVIAFPNPSASNFTINVKANTNEKIIMQVIDMYGRVIETRNVIANSITRFGDRYRAGTYFVKVIQGNLHKELKLVKIADW
jgi:hypothetical protein